MLSGIGSDRVRGSRPVHFRDGFWDEFIVFSDPVDSDSDRMRDSTLTVFVRRVRAVEDAQEGGGLVHGQLTSASPGEQILLTLNRRREVHPTRHDGILRCVRHHSSLTDNDQSLAVCACAGSIASACVDPRFV